MSIVANTKLEPSLNFRKIDSSKSSPQYRKVYPANGGARDLELSQTGAVQSTIFNIPTDDVNMGESYLEYNLTVAAQGGYIWQYKDKHGEIQDVLYRDTGSMNIVDAKEVYRYQDLTNRLNYSSKDLEFSDNLFSLVPSNALLSDVKSIRFDGTTNSLAFKEPQQMAMITSAAAGTASNIIYKKIYLKDLVKDSFFGLSKPSIMPIETYLEINFSNNAGRVAFLSLSAVNPNSTPTALTAKVDLRGLVLNLCYETNQDLIKAMKEEVAKGLSIPIPVYRHHLLAVPSNPPYVYNLPIDNKSHGSKIKRIIYAPYIRGGNVNLLYDHTNLNAAPKISSYNTELDNAKLQRDSLSISTTANDDFMNNRSLLKGSLFFNQPIYNQNWCHIDSWSYNDNLEQIGGGAILTDGLLMDKPRTWSFNCLGGTAGNYDNVAVVVGQKTLVVSPTSFLVI